MHESVVESYEVSLGLWSDEQFLALTDAQQLRVFSDADKGQIEPRFLKHFGQLLYKDGTVIDYRFDHLYREDHS
jgi:hypothetical protein